MFEVRDTQTGKTLPIPFASKRRAQEFVDHKNGLLTTGQFVVVETRYGEGG